MDTGFRHQKTPKLIIMSLHKMFYLGTDKTTVYQRKILHIYGNAKKPVLVSTTEHKPPFTVVL